MRTTQKHDDTLTEAQYRAVVAKARELYADPSDNDIEIDDRPEVGPAEDGFWVAAWVWIYADDMKGGV